MKAYLDTTILADSLVKSSEIKKRTRLALSRFESSVLPVYAIKEFKAGVLVYLIWLHNKLVDARSLKSVYEAIHSVMRNQKGRAATAMEALAFMAEKMGTVTNESLTTKYGPSATQDEMTLSMYRICLKTLIINSWKNRNRIASRSVNQLSCYDEVAPFEKDGKLFYKPIDCDAERGCCLSALLAKDSDTLTSIREALEGMPEKRETKKRLALLRDIIRKPKDIISIHQCRDLGDVYFVVTCPEDSVILTTNVVDFNPLANSIGRQVLTPKDALTQIPP